MVDAGRVQDLDNRSTVKQALWTLAGELGLLSTPDPTPTTATTPGASLAVRGSGPVARLRRGREG